MISVLEIFDVCVTKVHLGKFAGGGNVMCVCLYQKSVCKVTVPKVCTVGLYSLARRVHLFIVNCLLKNKLNMHVIYYLHI